MIWSFEKRDRSLSVMSVDIFVSSIPEANFIKSNFWLDVPHFYMIRKLVAYHNIPQEVLDTFTDLCFSRNHIFRRRPFHFRLIENALWDPVDNDYLLYDKSYDPNSNSFGSTIDLDLPLYTQFPAHNPRCHEFKTLITDDVFVPPYKEQLVKYVVGENDYLRSGYDWNTLPGDVVEKRFAYHTFPLRHYERPFSPESFRDFSFFDNFVFEAKFLRDVMINYPTIRCTPLHLDNL